MQQLNSCSMNMIRDGSSRGGAAVFCVMMIAVPYARQTTIHMNIWEE